MILHEGKNFTVTAEIGSLGGDVITLTSKCHVAGIKSIDKVVILKEDLTKMLALFDDKEGM